VRLIPPRSARGLRRCPARSKPKPAKTSGPKRSRSGARGTPAQRRAPAHRAAKRPARSPCSRGVVDTRVYSCPIVAPSATDRAYVFIKPGIAAQRFPAGDFLSDEGCLTFEVRYATAPHGDD
jgi:hypothetical protein